MTPKRCLAEGVTVALDGLSEFVGRQVLRLLVVPPWLFGGEFGV